MRQKFRVRCHKQQWRRRPAPVGPDPILNLGGETIEFADADSIISGELRVVFWASTVVVTRKKVIRSRIVRLDARGAQLEVVLRERCRSIGRPNTTGASRELVIAERSVIRPQSVPRPLTGGQGETSEVTPYWFGLISYASLYILR
jgi:hypothetical protein